MPINTQAEIQRALGRAVAALIDASEIILQTSGDAPPWLDAALLATQEALYHHAQHGSNPT